MRQLISVRRRKYRLCLFTVLWSDGRSCFLHITFGLASSQTDRLQMVRFAVVIGIVVVAAIAVIKFKREKEESLSKRTERRMKDEASRRKRTVLSGASHSD